jgi:hypothetical protein
LLIQLTMRSNCLQIFVALVLITACGPNQGNGPPDEVSPDLGAPCTTAAQCLAGYCVDGPAGDVCTYPCTRECPEGFGCRVTHAGGALVSLCLPDAGESCVSCNSDEQCPGGACIIIDGARHCLTGCDTRACAPGYICAADPDGTHAGKFCLPDTGSCTCNARAVGQQRVCSRTNSIGTCQGVEICAAAGWGPCSAADAVAETCDGADNDCDSLIDDGVGGGACTIDNGLGSCPGKNICTSAGSMICQGPTPAVEVCNYADDDCDLERDEDYPGVNTVCTVGTGACERSGVVRCTADGQGTECSAVEGAPTSELCNGIDDNCDTFIDEPFTDLASTCTVGVGLCARAGQIICDASGSGTTCLATPGSPDATETCNGVDDTCDGQIDEGFRNQGTGQYDQDIACGGCGIDCTQSHDLPNAAGACVVSGSPTCGMRCDPNAFNLDGVVANGCELVLDPQAIYVSVDDPAAVDDSSCGLGPVGTGSGHHPCRTIAQGNARAISTARARLRVANGTYAEPVTLVNGKELLGGHVPGNWERDVAATGTLITGVSVTGNHDRTVIATGITSPTLVEGFVIYGSVNTKTAGNSYGIYISNSTANLAIRRNIVFAGRGGPGANGGAGTAALQGVNGIGRISDPPGYDAKQATGTGSCNFANDRSYANGGVRSCGSDDVSGGNGGGNRCPPTSSCAGCGPSGCLTCTFTEFAGLDGATGQAGNPSGGLGGAGGDAGDDAVLAQSGCFLPSDPTYGRDGANGGDAAHGNAVAGCSGTAGSVFGGHWVGGAAPNGIAGQNGGGGGGGGAGGGAKCQGCPAGQDLLGGHGGGGGSGGCGGSGGVGASAGGGAFAIFIVGAPDGAPVIDNNSLFRGEGGRGGAGGPGAVGGLGGLGGGGGISSVFCADAAGRGGNGGNGGHGSGGGGGCGGSSVGIYTSGIGEPNYCLAAQNNTISSGAGGGGGAGGYSISNPGGGGSSGALQDCSFN